MNLPRASVRTAAAIAVVALLVAAPVASSARGAPAECPEVSRGDLWTTVHVPEFPSGGATTGFAAEPATVGSGRNALRVYATDGETIVRTTNGFCGWDESFAIGDASAAVVPAAGTRIVQLAAPQTVPNAVFALAVVDEAADAGGRPRIFRTGDGGDSWAEAAGLPPAGRPEVLRLAPSDPSIGYLGVDFGDGAIDTIYASEDEGRTWSLRSDAGGIEPSAGIQDLAVDPLDSQTLWAWGTTGVFRSGDGGRSFARVDEFASTPAGPGTLFHLSGQPTAAAIFRPGEGDFLGTADDGATWARIPSPPNVQSVGAGRDPFSMLIAAVGNIYAFHLPSLSWIEIEAPRRDVVDLTWVEFGERLILGHTDDTIEIYTGPVQGRMEVDDDGEPVVEVPDLSAPPPPEDRRPVRFGPDRRRIRLRTGETETITYRLGIPADRTPLDVYFLIDTSDSMTHTIDGLRRGIAAIIDGLHGAGVDVQFGVGEYRAYPDSQIPRADEPNFVYRRVRDIQPFSDTLAGALASLEADAGGRFESHLSALLHTALGHGEDVYPPGPSARDVPPGQQATYRAGALRVVIHATDSEFGRQEDARNFQIQDFGQLGVPDYPSFGEVITALQQRDILHVGLAVGAGARSPKYGYDDGRKFPTAMGDLGRFARETGAVAPAGVDCDGDGVADIGVGSPLVCALDRRSLEQGDAIVPAIVNLVKAVRQFASVTLQPARGGAVVEEIAPSRYPAVELQSQNELEFDVTFECPAELAGERVPVTLQARTPASGLAHAFVTVVCEPEPPLFAFPFEPLIALAFPPIPPPPPLTEIATTAQSQAQAQFGFAAQKQEQPQLAFVASGPASELETAAAAAADEESIKGYSMSSLRTSTEVPPERTLATGAAIVAFMYACTMLARVHVARAHVRTRRF